METKLEDNLQIGTLALEGEITIHSATQIKSQLLEALEKVDVCLLDMERVTQIDLSGLQLLYSAYLYADSRNSKLELKETCSLAVLNTIKESGFDKVEWLSF